MGDRDLLLEIIRQEQTACSKSLTKPIRIDAKVDQEADTISKVSFFLNCGHVATEPTEIRRTDEASLVCSKCLIFCAECGQTIEPGEALHVEGSWYHRSRGSEAVNCSVFALAEAENRKRAEEDANRQTLLEMREEMSELRHEVSEQRRLSERQVRIQEDLQAQRSVESMNFRARPYNPRVESLNQAFRTRAGDQDLFRWLKEKAEDIADSLPSEEHPVFPDDSTPSRRSRR